MPRGACISQRGACAVRPLVISVNFQIGFSCRGKKSYILASHRLARLVGLTGLISVDLRWRYHVVIGMPVVTEAVEKGV